MKKILLASTALVVTAGMAAAEVSFGGYGRFGIGYKENRSTDDNVSDTILVSRFRLNIDANVETDGGIGFSGRVRLQADENADTGEANTAGLNGARFSVIYGGLRVDAGNVSGVFDNLNGYYGNEVGLELFVGQYSGVDYSILTYTSTGAGANAVFFQYAVGDFAFGASYDEIDPAVGDGEKLGVSATYSFNNITAALAYGQTDLGGDAEKESLTVLTLAADFGDLNATLFVADDDVADEADNGTAYGVSAAYNVGGNTTLIFAYGDGSADNDNQQIGFGMTYDLGGGASLRGGIGRSKAGDGESVNQADFGALFNF